MATLPAHADHPDVRGIYDGTGYSVITNCIDPADNGEVSYAVTLNIHTQNADSFMGNATATAPGLEETFEISGLVEVSGSVHGTFTSDLYIGNEYDSSGAGAFSGVVAGVNLALQFQGSDTIGDTCDFQGAFSGVRDSEPPPIIDDQDQDGVADSSDNCPSISNPNQENFDGDSLGDVCDPDDDNDGLSDTDEAQYGTNPFNPDTDGDGVSDGAEVAAGTDPLVPNAAPRANATTVIINSLLLQD